MRHPQQNAQALYEVAAEQGGYFTAAQAREAGYAYSQQHYHRSRGNWLPIDRGIFRLNASISPCPVVFAKECLPAAFSISLCWLKRRLSHDRVTR
jgi:hypothetical protein